MKKIKPIYWAAVFAVAFCCVAVATQAGNAGQVGSSTFLPVGSGDNSRQADIQAVCNVIENMQNGDITAGQAKDEIQWKLQFAKNDCDCSPEEMKVNKRYVEFLEAAKDVTKTKMGGASESEIRDKINEMNEKKDLI